MNDPKIRFKGYTDAWEQRKLNEIAQKVTEKNKDNLYDEPFTNSAEQGIISQKDYFDREVVNEENLDGYYVVQDNDFVYNPRVSVTAPVGPINRNKLGRNGVMSPLYTVFRIHDVDAGYLEYYFKTTSWHRFMKLNGDSGARFDRFSIASSLFMEMPIPYPNIEEQARIGEYFDTLDTLITLHQRKCEETKKLKKYMLQKMFPQNGESAPEIRFAGFTDAWEQRKLGDFGIATGGTSIESEFSENGKYKVISIGSYSEQSTYTDQGLRTDKTEKTEKRILNKNDLTMILNDKTNTGRIIGRVLLIDADDSYVFNQRTERIEVDTEKYNPQFLYAMLNADNIRNKIIKAAQGNTQIYVNWPVISEFNYPVPIDLEEQKKLGEFFGIIDKIITLHQRKCDELQNMKKFMLQNMFA
ncbi:MAG: restriction endonuclease subunit S [Schaedlerella sp.]|nr:restriction endonuclease subunit S [Schaedlerella sp.]